MAFLTPGEELKLYRGIDFYINEFFTIHVPTLDEICNFDESKYFSMIYTVTATPTDLCVQLWDNGIDFSEVTDYTIFCKFIAPLIYPEETGIIFGDLDLRNFTVEINPLNNSVILVSPDRKWFIDEYTYEVAMTVLRKIHFLTKNVVIPGNSAMKEVLIEDTREEILMRKKEESHSYLENLISTMVNMDGFKYNHEEVWNLKINIFMDSVRRIDKVKNADLLLQSGYSGFGINLKEINKKQLDWMGPL